MQIEKYEKLYNLATDLLSQVRAEALVSLRFLDVALYKLKFNYDLNTTIYTDGQYLTASPYFIFDLYKEENNLLLRTYLHIVFHCIFFHLFIDKTVDARRWNLACDISVENIINELHLPTLVPDKDNVQIKELGILKQQVDELTAEKLYRYFIDVDISDFDMKRLEELFVRDDHSKWYVDEEKTVDAETKKKNNDSQKRQEKDELNDEAVERNEHEENNEEDDKEAKNNENVNNLQKDQEEEDNMEEEGDEASNIEGDKNKSDTGEDENPDADSTNKSDINDNSKNEEERLGGEESDKEVRTKNIDESKEGDAFSSLKDKISDSIGREKNKTEESNVEEKAENIKGSNLKTTKTKKDEDGTYYDWKNISERTKEDLLMFENVWGDRTHTLKQYIRFVNEEKYNYEQFLEKFAIMGESVELNDEEFDNIYYTYGLSVYKNVPLVEPLEYKEARKIKDFVVAIDVSGSVKGELVEKFLEKTYTILSKRDNYFSKVNIHIVLCDAEIKSVYKISNLNELKTLINDITLSGFGGTDFRPVFNYIDRMRETGELKNLKGLIYFTDGLGEYPKTIPSYDTAFVFMKDNYETNAKKIMVPPWAIKLVLDDV